MANIIVLEIDKKYITPKVGMIIKEMSKFYEIFNSKVIAILYENTPILDDLYNHLFWGEDAYVEIYRLNHFAKSRLINNFEDDRPELTLCLMGCSENSKIIKIWEKHVKR